MPVATDLNLDQRTLPASNYGYSATRLDDLGAAEYTLVTVVCDASPSISPFVRHLTEALKQIVLACRYSPRADNLMLRLVQFNHDMRELHGFKLLQFCNVGDYDGILSIAGKTALYDAAANAVNATTDYALHLATGDFSANGIVFVLTDGGDNASIQKPAAVKKALMQAVREEALESMVSILIGMNVRDANLRVYLDHFHTEAGFTQFIAIDDADAKTLARIADFVTRSISVQSQALGTGGPSKSLTF